MTPSRSIAAVERRQAAQRQLAPTGGRCLTFPGRRRVPFGVDRRSRSKPRSARSRSRPATGVSARSLRFDRAGGAGSTPELEAAATQLQEYFAGAAGSSSWRSRGPKRPSTATSTRARRDPVRRANDLRRGHSTARARARPGSQGRGGDRAKPAADSDPLPSRGGRRRLADRLRRRAGAKGPALGARGRPVTADPP